MAAQIVDGLGGMRPTVIGGDSRGYVVEWRYTFAIGALAKKGIKTGKLCEPLKRIARHRNCTREAGHRTARDVLLIGAERTYQLLPATYGRRSSVYDGNFYGRKVRCFWQRLCRPAERRLLGDWNTIERSIVGVNEAMADSLRINASIECAYV